MADKVSVSVIGYSRIRPLSTISKGFALASVQSVIEYVNKIVNNDFTGLSVL